MLEPVLGLVGTLLGLARAVPQLWLVALSPSRAGVSIDAAATSCVVSLGWTVYGLWTSQLAVVLATGLSGLVFGAIAVLVSRGRGLMSGCRLAPLSLGLLGVIAWRWGASGLAVALPLAVLVANGPQVLTAIKQTDLSGLSSGTWVLSTCDGLVWTSYSLVSGDRALLTFGLLQISTSSVILALKQQANRRQPESSERQADCSGTADPLMLAE